MSETQARAFIDQAKLQLGSWSFVWSSTNNLEAAAELYIKAGNNFQLVSLCKTAIIYLFVVQYSSVLISAIHLLGKDAGDAYSEAAKLYKRADHSTFEAAQAFEKAAKSYKKVSPKGKCSRLGRQAPFRSRTPCSTSLRYVDALMAMIAAITLDKASGSFRIAARHSEEVAQLYEGQIDDQQKAYDYYEEAAHLYHMDNSPTYVRSF
jgi:alpha-soluble NSF attachment protein